jgi:hypothetical protein
MGRIRCGTRLAPTVVFAAHLVRITYSLPGVARDSFSKGLSMKGEEAMGDAPHAAESKDDADDASVVYTPTPPLYQGEYRYKDGRILIVEVEVRIFQEHINAYFARRVIAKPTLDDRKIAEQLIARFGYWLHTADTDQSRIRHLGTGWRGRASYDRTDCH